MTPQRHQTPESRTDGQKQTTAGALYDRPTETENDVTTRFSGRFLDLFMFVFFPTTCQQRWTAAAAQLRPVVKANNNASCTLVGLPGIAVVGHLGSRLVQLVVQRARTAGAADALAVVQHRARRAAAALDAEGRLGADRHRAGRVARLVAGRSAHGVDAAVAARHRCSPPVTKNASAPRERERERERDFHSRHMDSSLQPLGSFTPSRMHSWKKRSMVEQAQSRRSSCWHWQ